MKKLLLRFVVFIIASFSVVYAQEMRNQNDFVVLPLISMKYNVSHFTAVTLDTWSYFNDNARELGQSFVDVGVHQKLNKSLKISGDFAFSLQKVLNNSYQKQYQFYADLAYTHKLWGKWQWNYRGRLQDQYYETLIHPDKSNKLYLRNRILLSYRYDWYLEPYVSYELYYPLNRPNRKFIDQYRATVGFNYRLNMRNQLSAYYQIRKPLVMPATTMYMLAMGYSFTF